MRAEETPPTGYRIPFGSKQEGRDHGERLRNSGNRTTETSDKIGTRDKQHDFPPTPYK